MDVLKLTQYLAANPPGKVVDFNKHTDKLYPFDFTAQGDLPAAEIIDDTNQFSAWVADKLEINNCRYGIGGYQELRVIYARSSLFNANEEPRRFHLGVDIWAPAYTPVYCPLPATVHSFRYNDNYGDYGATIILKHQLDDMVIHSLYGHLSLASLNGLEKNAFIPQGKHFADFGDIAENGNWPPHLHFQLIVNMDGYDGDYPGVCRFSEREKYLENSPDPQLFLANSFREM